MIVIVWKVDAKKVLLLKEIHSTSVHVEINIREKDLHLFEFIYLFQKSEL